MPQLFHFLSLTLNKKFMKFNLPPVFPLESHAVQGRGSCSLPLHMCKQAPKPGAQAGRWQPAASLKNTRSSHLIFLGRLNRLRPPVWYQIDCVVEGRGDCWVLNVKYWVLGADVSCDEAHAIRTTRLRMLATGWVWMNFWRLWHARGQDAAQANPSDLIKPQIELRKRGSSSGSGLAKPWPGQFLLGLRLGNR